MCLFGTTFFLPLTLDPVLGFIFMYLETHLGAHFYLFHAISDDTDISLNVIFYWMTLTSHLFYRRFGYVLIFIRGHLHLTFSSKKFIL